MIIDKSSSTPLYIQLKNILKQSIMSHEICEGEPIPSETQLAQQYSITRSTVRMAITELVNENLLRREHGKGTFVCFSPIRYSMLNFGSFSEYCSRKDKVPVSRILTAEKLAGESGDFFKLVRARGIREDGKVLYLTVDSSLIPLAVFPNIDRFDFSQLSLYRVMSQEYGVIPDRVELSVKAQLAGQSGSSITAIFSVEENEPLLQAKGRVYSEDNRLVEKLNVIYSPQTDFKLATRISASLS